VKIDQSKTRPLGSASLRHS